MSMIPIPNAATYKKVVVIAVTIPLLGVLAAITLAWNQYVFWQDIALLVSLYMLTGLGITIGYHRMVTHDGFKTYAPIRAFFMILGCMAFEGPPETWAATHIHHHAESDQEGDPHSPVEGFWHAHFGWIIRGEMEDPAVWTPQLLQDPVVMFVSKYYLVWITLSLLIPFAIGGWTGLVWGGLVRIFLVNHITWSVNSVCHTFGKQPFDSKDKSRNEWIVGLLAFGEGWHNNHHAFPKSAFHGLHWWQFDLSGLIIRGMERLGLVWKVERVSKELMEAKKNHAVSLKEICTDLQNQLSETMKNARLKSDQMTEAHLYVTQRLEEIKEVIARSSTLKKQKAQEYLQEVKELAARLQHLQA